MRHACTELRPLEQVPRCWRRPCATDRHALAADRSAGRKRGSAHALWSESWRHTVLHVQSLHPEARKVNVAATGLRIGRLMWPGLGRRDAQSRGTPEPFGLPNGGPFSILGPSAERESGRPARARSELRTRLVHYSTIYQVRTRTSVLGPAKLGNTSQGCPPPSTWWTTHALTSLLHDS